MKICNEEYRQQWAKERLETFLKENNPSEKEKREFIENLPYEWEDMVNPGWREEHLKWEMEQYKEYYKEMDESYYDEEQDIARIHRLCNQSWWER